MSHDTELLFRSDLEKFFSDVVDKGFTDIEAVNAARHANEGRRKDLKSRAIALGLDFNAEAAKIQENFVNEKTRRNL